MPEKPAPMTTTSWSGDALMPVIVPERSPAAGRRLSVGFSHPPVRMGGMDIDPDDLKTCLDVLARIDELPVEHPDAVAVRRATAGIFKSVKERRRVERRAAAASADRAVFAATATAAPGRI